MKTLRIVLVALVALLLLFLSQGHAGHAASITVNTTADELNADGDCSLREAIQAANTDAAVDACTAGSGADSIMLPAGTYTLSIPGAGEDANATGDLDITDDLTINGAGEASTIIDGGALDRVFDVDPNNAGVTAELSGLSIQNGSVSIANPDGGGIRNSGTLTVNNSTVSGNMAAMDGGGIMNFGTLTVNNSTVAGNTSGSGGLGAGIENFGTATLNSTTISGNTALLDGGGIANLLTLTLNNSTVSGNTAAASSGVGGGIVSSYLGTATLNNCTVSDNTAVLDGGGIFIYQGAVTVKNTIVASNNGDDCAGASITSVGHNLDSDSTCGLGAPGDLPNTDPQLGPLADNGGPTQTHTLQTGSPAIDAGDNSGCPATDQRGFGRPVDGDGNGSAICDMGAYEFGASPPVPVGGIAELPDADASAGRNYVALAGLAAAAVVALSAGAWYGRRRFSRS